jgi:glycosyltransferase involved in cell wall biosynthesis
LRQTRRILLLVTDLQIGGTPTVVRELAVRLNAPPGVVVDVACLAGHGAVVDQLNATGIRTFPLGACRATDFRIFPRLARLIAENQYDTVFSFLVHANAAAAIVAPFCRDVRFLQSIQTTQPEPRWHWRVQSMVQYAADRIVVPSPSVAAVAGKWADIPLESIVVIPNAIEMKDFSFCGTGAPPVQILKHGRGARATVDQPIPIGFIGRLDPIKRIPDLIEAMRLVKLPLHLHLFGEGAERKNIELMIRRLDLSRTVTLHGEIARPQEALKQIELLVLPSVVEGFGLVLIEAMAAGIPVVATDVPGIRDVVRNEQTGLLVPPYSPPPLGEAIERVLRDDSLRQRLIERGRRDVKRFTWEVALPQYRSLLEL